jgi:hypothetical protein
VRRRGRPPLHVVDLDGDVRTAERLADQLGRPRRIHGLADGGVLGAVRVEGGEHREEAGVAGDGEPEEPEQLRVVDVDHAEVAVPDELAQVRAEVDGDAVGERPAPGQLDAAARADRAVRAVGGDQVVGADGLGRAAVPGTEDRRDPVVVLLEGDQLGGVGVLGAALLGRPAQQRLQPDLGDEQPRRGAQRLDALVEVPEEELHLRAGQTLHRDDGAVLQELLRRRGLDLLLEPRTAEDLHGPLVERGGPWVDRGAAVPFDQQVWHRLRRQQQRRRQPHEAASDDQDG